MFAVAPKLQERIRQIPRLLDVTSDLQLGSRQASIDIDRDAAGRLGGSREVSTIFTPSNDYRVILEVAPKDKEDPSALSRLYVRTDTGTLVPLDAIARVRLEAAPLSISHQGQLPAVTISFNLAAGTSLGQAVQAIEQAQRDIGMPASILAGFQGTAEVFQSSMGNQIVLIVAALVTIYIVLGILYESFVHPLTILSGLPSAGIGALLTLMAFGQDLNVIAQRSPPAQPSPARFCSHPSPGGRGMA